MALVTAISAIVAAVGALATYGTLQSVIIAVALSLTLSLATYLLAPKPQKWGLTSYGDGDFTRQFRQPTPERTYVYGECRVSGAIAFIGSTDDNKYLHMVILLADHEINDIGEIIINDQSVPKDYLDNDGMVNAGVYAGKVRIKKHLGATNQLADSDLVSEVTDWTDNHRLQGIAYIYARLEFDRNIFTSGIPNISAYIRGKKIIDSRDSQLKYTSNLALITKDYLTDSKVGFSVLESELA